MEEDKRIVSYNLKKSNIKKVDDISYKKRKNKSKIVDEMIEEFEDE